MIDIDNLRRELNEIATDVNPVDLRERALATSHRIRVRRTAATTVAGLAVATVALSTAAALGTDRTPAPPAVTPGPAIPSPTQLPTERPDSQPDLGPFKSATITVPTWGTAAAAAACPKGRVTLNAGGQSSGGRRLVNVLSYVAVDVDHDGAEDYVAHLMCGEGPEAGGSQVVAFRRDGQTLVPIGRIVGTQDGIRMMDHVEGRTGGRVAILVAKEYTDGGEETVPNQWRTYAWRHGQFQQVDGPTTFPAKSPAALLSAAVSTLVFRPVGSGFTGQMTVTVRNDGDLDVARLRVLLILPGQVRPTGDGWAGCTVRPGDDPSANQTALVCAVAGPRAQSRVSIPFTFVAADKPVPLDDPVTLGNHYVSISQQAPFGGQVTINEPEAVIPVSVQ
ncbi:hypothetical protein [Krasilnikovia sp. M28-CT-15]|uniref:hypothetical protein n=1 Tax=Krasilnikovia sp. M28-CT-15 TaxID=3373540 RepID=UPI003877766D